MIPREAQAYQRRWNLLCARIIARVPQAHTLAFQYRQRHRAQYALTLTLLDRQGHILDLSPLLDDFGAIYDEASTLVGHGQWLLQRTLLR